MTGPRLFGPYGAGALRYAERFPELGANAAWFHGFDPDAFETCARYGIQACVEFATFRTDFSAHPELAPIGVDGKPIRYGDLVQGVCLSQPDFLAELEAKLLSGLRTYQPAGIWLDYLTYAGWFETPDPDLQESCFCPACTAHFCETTGIDATSPEEILTHYAEDWTRHKCLRIATFGERYAALIREHHPECLVGAYMCPWTPTEHGGALQRIFAQDYALLAPHIEVFTPLIYGVKSGRMASWGREFLEAAPTFIPKSGRVQLIMDARDGPESIEAVATAAVPSWGLQVFGGAALWEQPELGAAFARAVREIEIS
jgi:hypothetical protein